MVMEHILDTVESEPPRVIRDPSAVVGDKRRVQFGLLAEGRDELGRRADVRCSDIVDCLGDRDIRTVPTCVGYDEFHQELAWRVEGMRDDRTVFGDRSRTGMDRPTEIASGKQMEKFKTLRFSDTRVLSPPRWVYPRGVSRNIPVQSGS